MSTQTLTEWLESRRAGIGGSDVGALLGVNPWSDAQDVWLSKMGLDEQKDSPAMKRGRYMESMIADLYSEVTGRDLEMVADMFHHPKIPIMLGNIDRKIVGDDRGPGVLEIKAPGVYGFSEMELKGIPKHYMCQIQHYLAVTGFSWAAFVAFNAEKWELLHWDVERDDVLIGQLEKVSVDFWANHVGPQIAPDGHEPPQVNIKSVGAGKDMEDSTLFMDAMSNLSSTKGRIAYHESNKKLIEEEIKDLMGSNDCDLAYCSLGKVTYKTIEGRKTLDQKSMAADGIDLEKYRKRGKPSHYFRATFKKGE